MSRKKNETGAAPEWSHMIEADKIDSSPRTIRLEPTPEERTRLAKRIGVVSLDVLQAEVTMSRDSGSRIVYVSGHLTARVGQVCVITGKKLKNDIVDTFEAWYADPQQSVSFAKAKMEREVLKGVGETPMLEESEDPEAIEDGQIDIGELTAQFLSLAIDPYPQAEGADVPEVAEQKEKTFGEVFENPFAALKNWKAGKGKE